MTRLILTVCTLLVGVLLTEIQAEDFVNYDWEQVKDLSGLWKFEIGDNAEWADPEFDDRRWESIHVPSSWEDEGFPGYDGFAWYRTTFAIGAQYRETHLALFLGYIDDADEVYLNGKLINFEGSMPPEVHTAYHVLRTYHIPSRYINFEGTNVIAVRVYDNYQTGGIIRGNIGIYAAKSMINLEIPLSGSWKFRTGDHEHWKNPGYDDTHWDEIQIPALWETQGYRNYDGIAWHRKSFFLPYSYEDVKIILLLGKIDDFDETFLNGKRIGRKGIIRDDLGFNDLGNTYRELRAYYLPREYLNYGGENLIAVRVYDGFIKGGIYEGPIGIVTRDDYLSWWKEVRQTPIRSIFEKIFGN